MHEERSPCLQCEHLKMDKSKCAKSCKELDRFKENLPQFSLSPGDSFNSVGVYALSETLINGS